MTNVVKRAKMQPDRLEELVNALPGCLEAVQADLASFIELLKKKVR